MRVVVTGASGFIGQAVAQELTGAGHHVVAWVRHLPSPDECDAFGFADLIVTGPLEALGDFSQHLRNADAVVHTANWTGEPSRLVTPTYAEGVNVDTTQRLCAQAAQAGVRHFVYVSSTKAVADYTTSGSLSAATEPNPLDLYGQTKLRAERALATIPGIGVSIVRPPPVYGPGMKSGLLTLFKLAQRGVPLPLASIHNQRDFLAVSSLAGLIARCLDRPPAEHGCDPRILMVCDGEPVSSAGLYVKIADALGVKARVWHCPPSALRAMAIIPGLGRRTESLLNSLRIDDSDTREQLGWQPRCTLAEGLARTAAWLFEHER